MGKTPKISGVLQGNCCETFHNLPQKTNMDKFNKKNSSTG